MHHEESVLHLWCFCVDFFARSQQWETPTRLGVFSLFPTVWCGCARCKWLSREGVLSEDLRGLPMLQWFCQESWNEDEHWLFGKQAEVYQCILSIEQKLQENPHLFILLHYCDPAWCKQVQWFKSLHVLAAIWLRCRWRDLLFASVHPVPTKMWRRLRAQPTCQQDSWPNRRCLLQEDLLPLFLLSWKCQHPQSAELLGAAIQLPTSFVVVGVANEMYSVFMGYSLLMARSRYLTSM